MNNKLSHSDQITEDIFTLLKDVNRLPWQISEIAYFMDRDGADILRLQIASIVNFGLIRVISELEHVCETKH